MNTDGPTGEPASHGATHALRSGLVAEFGTAALQGVDLDTLLNGAAAVAARGMGVSHGKVLRYRPEHDDLLVCAGVNWGPGVVGHATLSANLKSPPGFTLRTGEPTSIQDLRVQDQFEHSALLRDHGVVSLLNVPVRTDGEIWGVLEVDSEQPGHFTAEHAHFLQGLANVLGAAIRRLRIEQALADAKANLERGIAERTRQLTESNRQLRNQISERERIETELRRREAEYRTLYNRAPAPQHSLDADGCIVGVSDSWLELFGYHRDEVLGRPIVDFMPEAAAQAFRDAWPGFLAAGEERGRDTQFHKRSGEVIDVLLSGRTERDSNGAVRRALGVLTDITAWRRAERERDRLFEISGDLIVIAAFDGRIRDINPAMERSLGYALQELRGRRFAEFVLPEDRPKLDAALARLRHGQAVPQIELRYRRRDGEWRAMSWRATAVAEEGLIYALGRDVSEQRQTEEALRQAQKMEAVGHLTGGVAHDFNNLLTVVLGNLELLRPRIAERANLVRMVDAMQHAVERGERLTSQLLAFSRRQKLQPETLDLNALVTEFVPLMRRAVGESVRVETRLAAGLWPVHIDAAQLEAALLNLTVNAGDAMPEGGHLLVETRNVESEERLVTRVAEANPGPYVLVAVSDTGTGMPPEVIARAFEPFFTTKEIGKGTGLGLSQVYGFVEQSGGHVTIDSEAGKGTSIRLYLPPASTGAIGPRDEAESGDALRRGSERILLVEDNPDVLRTGASMLADLGYAVLVASGPAEALDMLRGDEPFDLLFSDVVMPQMTGPQLAAQARRLRPGLKVLLTSGYSREGFFAPEAPDPGIAVIGKPYRQGELATRLRAVLDGEEA